MSANNVAIIFGAGARVGASVAAKFASIGYRVALVSRNGAGAINDQGYLTLKADFNDPQSVAPAFDAVQAEFNIAPNVVIYNAGALSFPTDKTSVLSVPVDKVANDLNINTVSPYVAAQEAVKRWETLPAATKKTFIYTGNASNDILAPNPLWLTLGMGKSATAFWIGLSDKLYEAKGYRYVSSSLLVFSLADPALSGFSTPMSAGRMARLRAMSTVLIMANFSRDWRVTKTSSRGKLPL